MQILLYVAVPVAMILVAIVIYKRVSSGDASENQAGATTAGPQSPGLGTLRPVVDLMQCMGSGGCVRACPDQALSVVRGKAVLVDPARCLGHGACARACPVGAITLVAKAS